MANIAGPLTAASTAAIPNTGGNNQGNYSEGGQWTNAANGAVDDGSSASAGGASTQVFTDHLKSAGHGFNIPAGAVVVGIVVEIKMTSNGMFLNAALTKGTSKNSSVLQGNGYRIFGSATDLWGTTWTGAEVSDPTFGAKFWASTTSGNGGNVSVDSMRITVYWETAPADVPSRFFYKVFRNNAFLGLLPQPKNKFKVPQEINTVGSQISLEIPTTADTSRQPTTGPILLEDGTPLLDEAGNAILSEGAVSLVGLGNSNSLIKNGNQLVVVEVNYYYPNGRVAFRGTMERWEALFGGSDTDNIINVLCYSDGTDLDNYLLLGSANTYTADQQQNSQNTSNIILNDSGEKGAGYNFYGQSFTVGAGVTNISAVLLKLQGAATVTVTLYESTAMQTVLGATTLAVNTGGGAADVQFNFPARVVATAGSVRFFTVTIGSGTIYIFMQNSNVYAGGSAYNAQYAGGGGGGWGIFTNYDLYFRTYSSPGTTLATYPTQDPITGIYSAFMDDYVSRGGKMIKGTMQAAGLTVPWTFNTNTVYEGMQSMLSVCPAGFYYTVDLATNAVIFKQSSATADVLLVKGRHIAGLRLAASIENVANLAYVSGGQQSGANLYGTQQDGTSIAAYGQRLDRVSQNRAVTTAQVQAVANSAVATQKDEQFQTTVKVTNKYLNLALLKNGMTVGLRGYGTFVDTLVLRIVRIDYEGDIATLALGALPRRLDLALEQVNRGLLAQQTIANPSAPS
jgi:hypothetical protein